MGYLNRSKFTAAIGLFALAFLLIGCEIPSPTAQDPQPVDVVEEGEATEAPSDSSPAVDDAATPEPSTEEEGRGEGEDTDAAADSGTDATDDPSSDDSNEEDGATDAADDSAADGTDDTASTDSEAEEADPTAVPTVAEPTAVPTTEADEETAVQPTPVPSPTSTTQPEPTATTPATTDGNATEILHTVQPGENLYRIGLRYNVSWTVLQIYNGLPNANSLQVGQVIRIPVVQPVNNQPDESGITPTPSTAVVHNVIPGETLFLIGLRYGIPWNQIAEANGIMNPTSLKAGQQVKIPVEVVRNANEIQHLVTPGDSLFRISVQYGVPWSSIAARNNILSPYTIYPNEGLTIPALGQ